MKNPRKALVLFAYLSILVCFILFCRYFYLQVIRSEHFQEKVTEQRVKEMIQLPERGKILDRNGNVMALSLMAQDVNVYPNLIETKKHQEAVATLLSETLDVSYESVLKEVQTDKMWANIAKRVDYEKISKIKEADLGGIEITQSPKRYYPNDSVASGILGFVNQENVPGAGVELSLNTYLSGIPGYTVAETDNVGKKIPIGFENISTPVNGQKVSLTIDNYMQYVMEKRLEQAQEEMNPVSIHAILMKPQTGEVLAMASTPSFDPNNYGDYDPKTWTNTPVSYVYEPGSTFKPIYMALALENGKITPESTWYDGVGSINVNGTSLKNWDSVGLGEMTLETIITNSSNVGMVQISRSMTSKEIVNALKDKGFGQPTGIEIPGEEAGLFPSATQLENDPLMKATMSFGQGLAITPVQLITAFSEVINGGIDISPTLLDKVEDENGNVLYDRTEKEGETKQAYKKEVSDTMKTLLQANSHKGSGRDYQVDGYDSGTKTGSAWVVENGQYKKGVIIGSFIGFAPYENPEFSLLVVVNQPEGIEFGGPSAGPIWHDIMEEVLRYQSVPKELPTEDGEEKEEEKIVEIPTTEWLLVDDATTVLEEALEGVLVKKSGKGNVVYDRKYAMKNNQLQVTLQTKPLIEKDILYMPNLIGKTKEEVQALFKKRGIALKFHGDGVVAEQSIAPGRQSNVKDIVFWLQ